MAEPVDTPSYAIIDGSLCKLNRRGTVVKKRAPMGNSIAEFLVVGESLFVRENDEGFLPGMANLYCVDSDLMMVWLAEAPAVTDPFTGSLSSDGSVLCCLSREGRACRLGLGDGKLLG